MHTFPEYLTSYEEYLKLRGGSFQGVRGTLRTVQLFARFCEERGMLRPLEVDRLVVERYQRYLYHHKTNKDKPLTLSTQRYRLQMVVQFFRWSCRKRFLLHNPASELELPRAVPQLPKAVLSENESEIILSLPDVNTVLGLRDRALLELLYSSGMRRMEVASLCLDEIDLLQGLVYVRHGKGGRQRLLPLGERAGRWLSQYLRLREGLLTGSGEDEGKVFLSVQGKPFALEGLSNLVRAYVKRSGIGKGGSCHLFRHTMATMMLEGGADIAFVQKMLGHQNLNTTQVYTHLSVEKLREVHRRSHPAERHSNTSKPTEGTPLFP